MTIELAPICPDCVPLEGKCAICGKELDRGGGAIAQAGLIEELGKIISRYESQKSLADGQFEKAVELLSGFTDDEPCRFDHHGYCQTHGPGTIPCHMQKTREFLGEYE